MTTTAPPFGYSTRTGANWYFEGTISAGSLVVRGGSTIPTGTLGGLNIVSMAANHSAMWAWYNGWAVSTARTKISTISLIAATSVFDIGATAISAAAWPFVATMDQNVDTTGTPLFTSVRTLQGGQAFDYSLSAFGYNAISYARTTADLFNAPFTMWMDVSLARWGSLGRITIHEFSWATDNTVTGNAWMVTLGVSATVDGGDFFDGVVDAGFTDGVGANKLKDSSASFLSTVTIGDIVTNVTATPDTYATVTAIDSDIQLAIDADIFVSLQSYRVVHGSFIELGISRCTVDGTSAVLRVSYQYLGGPKLLFELLKHDGTDYDVTGGAPATIATDRHITFGIPYVLDGYTP